MPRHIRPLMSVALLSVIAAYPFASVRSAHAAAAQQAQATGPSAAHEERMPRAGIDPGGVITGIATRLPSNQVSTLRLRFEAGARTVWHTHVGPQLLLVEEGKARVQQKGGKIVDLKAGESIYLPPNVAHWHGAAPDSSVVMLSVYPIGSKLDAGPEVSEPEYLGKSQTGR